MAYIIQLDALSDSFEIENLTREAVKGHDASLIDLYEDVHGNDYPESFESTEEKADFIRESDYIHEIGEDFEPLTSYVHLLQCDQVPDESLIKLYESVPNLVILNHCESYYIGFTCAGVDLSASVAYAYMILDRSVPEGIANSALINEGQGLTSEEYSELVRFLDSK